MNTQEIISIILGLLQAFFGSNPTVEEIEVVVPQLIAALANAKAGKSFSVSFPLGVDGVKGNASFSWSPTA